MYGGPHTHYSNDEYDMKNALKASPVDGIQGNLQSGVSLCLKQTLNALGPLGRSQALSIAWNIFREPIEAKELLPRSG